MARRSTGCAFLSVEDVSEMEIIAYFSTGGKRYGYSLPRHIYQETGRRRKVRKTAETVGIINGIARHSCFKALNWCKKNGRLVYDEELQEDAVWPDRSAYDKVIEELREAYKGGVLSDSIVEFIQSVKRRVDEHGSATSRQMQGLRNILNVAQEKLNAEGVEDFPNQFKGELMLKMHPSKDGLVEHKSKQWPSKPILKGEVVGFRQRGWIQIGWRREFENLVHHFRLDPATPKVELFEKLNMWLRGKEIALSGDFKNQQNRFVTGLRVKITEVGGKRVRKASLGARMTMLASSVADVAEIKKEAEGLAGIAKRFIDKAGDEEGELWCAEMGGSADPGNLAMILDAFAYLEPRPYRTDIDWDFGLARVDKEFPGFKRRFRSLVKKLSKCK